MGRGSVKSLNWKSVREAAVEALDEISDDQELSLIHISEPTRPY